jgi:hypothetical protein
MILLAHIGQNKFRMAAAPNAAPTLNATMCQAFDPVLFG